MHPFSSCNHSLPATTAQFDSFLPTHFCPLISPIQSPCLPICCPPLPKQLPTIAQTVAHHRPNRCPYLPNTCPPLPNTCPPLPKQLPTIAQIFAHVCPPWDAMLTGSPSRILETLCEAFHSVSRVSCPPIISQVVFFSCHLSVPNSQLLSCYLTHGVLSTPAFSCFKSYFVVDRHSVLSTYSSQAHIGEHVSSSLVIHRLEITTICHVTQLVMVL